MLAVLAASEVSSAGVYAFSFMFSVDCVFSVCVEVSPQPVSARSKKAKVVVINFMIIANLIRDTKIEKNIRAIRWQDWPIRFALLSRARCEQTADCLSIYRSGTTNHLILNRGRAYRSDGCHRQKQSSYRRRPG